MIGNLDPPPIPAHFVTWGGAMIGPTHFQGIEKNSGGIIIIVSGRIPFAPGGERFPAKRDDDLLAPFQLVRQMPLLLDPALVPIEAKLPGTIQVEPIKAFQRPPLTVGPWILRPRISESI